ncbi:hypothetical protein P9112_010442 [Eukaryota sp. TZLM1-RC]
MAHSSKLSITDFELLETIGEGSYGKVFKALSKTGQLCAIKKIRLDSANKGDVSTLLKEVELLSSCEGDFVLSYIGAFMDDDFLYIVLEYCPYGSFSDLISGAGPLSEDQIRVVLKGVLHALALLHERRICHRDIKAANILLSNDFRPRLADFGVAAQLQHTLSKRNTIVGSPFWMDPVVIKGKPYSYHCDIWSLGITAIELAEGHPPYSKEFKHPMGALLAIPNRPPPQLKNKERWSTEFHSFLTYCLQSDPAQRKSATELLECDFIKKQPNQASNLLLELVDAAKLATQYGSTFELSSTQSTVVKEESCNFNDDFDPSTYGTARWTGDTIGGTTDFDFETVRLSTQGGQLKLNDQSTPLFVKKIREEQEGKERSSKLEKKKEEIYKMNSNEVESHKKDLIRQRDLLELELAELNELIDLCNTQDNDVNGTAVFIPNKIVD